MKTAYVVITKEKQTMIFSSAYTLLRCWDETFSKTDTKRLYANDLPKIGSEVNIGDCIIRQVYVDENHM